MNHITTARISRDDGHVVLSIGDEDEGYRSTFYITQDMAFDIAETIREIAIDINHVPPAESTQGTQVVMHTPENGDACHQSRIVKE